MEFGSLITMSNCLCCMRCFSISGMNWSVSVINVFSGLIGLVGAWILLLWIIQGLFRKTNQNHPVSLSSQSLLGSSQLPANHTTISTLLAGPMAHDTLDLLQNSKWGIHGMPRSICPMTTQIGVQCWQRISCKLSCSIFYQLFSLGLMTTEVKHVQGI